MISKQRQSLIQQIEKYTDENLHTNITLKKLARLTHYNPTYLSRLYHQTTGQTVNSYIKNKKINKSIQLLKIAKHNNITVARKLGYKNAESFSRFFKNNTGMTPNEYRFFLFSQRYQSQEHENSPSVEKCR